MRLRLTRVTYVIAVLVLGCTTAMSAKWRHGCCEVSNYCSDTKVCCLPPAGWGDCSLWLENYCNYDDCNLEDAGDLE